jgi:hypothetical protein
VVASKANVFSFMAILPLVSLRANQSVLTALHYFDSWPFATEDNVLQRQLIEAAQINDFDPKPCSPDGAPGRPAGNRDHG